MATTLTKNEIATFVKNSLKSKDVPKMKRAVAIYEKWANPVNIVGNYLDNLPVEILDIIKEKIPFDVRYVVRGLGLKQLKNVLVCNVNKYFKNMGNSRIPLEERKKAIVDCLVKHFIPTEKNIQYLLNNVALYKNIEENWTDDFTVGENVIHKYIKCQITKINKNSLVLTPYKNVYKIALVKGHKKSDVPYEKPVQIWLDVLDEEYTKVVKLKEQIKKEVEPEPYNIYGYTVIRYLEK
jgi:hypothetical protein